MLWLAPEKTVGALASFSCRCFFVAACAASIWYDAFVIECGCVMPFFTLLVEWRVLGGIKMIGC